jgi:hypothetical protein
MSTYITRLDSQPMGHTAVRLFRRIYIEIDTLAEQGPARYFDKETVVNFQPPGFISWIYICAAFLFDFAIHKLMRVHLCLVTYFSEGMQFHTCIRYF